MKVAVDELTSDPLRRACRKVYVIEDCDFHLILEVVHRRDRRATGRVASRCDDVLVQVMFESVQPYHPRVLTHKTHGLKFLVSVKIFFGIVDSPEGEGHPLSVSVGHGRI